MGGLTRTDNLTIEWTFQLMSEGLKYSALDIVYQLLLLDHLLVGDISQGKQQTDLAFVIDHRHYSGVMKAATY